MKLSRVSFFPRFAGIAIGCLICSSAQAASTKSLEADPPVFANESTSGGKVIRRKIADIPVEERAYAEQKLREFTEAVKGPKASPLCKGVTVFCRVDVPTGYVSFLAKYPKSAKAEKKDIGGIKVTLADIARSRFKSLKLIGYIGEGVGSSPPWSSVARLFQNERGNLVMLSEWDYFVDEGGIEQAEEFLNTRIGPYSASAMQNHASNGSSLWDLSWVEPRKQMKLYYYCPTSSCISQKTFIELANSLYD